MSESSRKENPKQLMNDLGDLVDFLSDGPEHQGELKLPQEELFATDSLKGHIDVPVLTAKVDETELPAADYDLDLLVDELVNLVMPRLEAELRQRLKKKISALPD